MLMKTQSQYLLGRLSNKRPAFAVSERKGWPTADPECATIAPSFSRSARCVFCGGANITQIIPNEREGGRCKGQPLVFKKTKTVQLSETNARLISCNSHTCLFAQVVCSERYLHGGGSGVAREKEREVSPRQKQRTRKTI